MPPVDSQQPLTASLLDRLIDLEPDVSTEPEWRRHQKLGEYESSVLRDIEALLNTRQARAWKSDDGELACSVLTYGLPDFSAGLQLSPTDREQLRVSVERALVLFEPRLRQIHVQLRPPVSPVERALRLTVEAQLWVHPRPVAIKFDTLVEPASGSCKVEAS
jgi:type VI secretion system protein ImpF